MLGSDHGGQVHPYRCGRERLEKISVPVYTFLLLLILLFLLPSPVTHYVPLSVFPIAFGLPYPLFLPIN